MNNDLGNFIKDIPKIELHLHIEGTFEPELMFRIADRNKLKINYNSVEEIKSAYKFNNLQEFLDIYYAGANVLQTEEDFFDLTMAYFYRVNKDNVVHAEIMFDPQTHTNRGIKFDTVINGIKHAQEKAEKELGITSKLIMSFLRHLDEDSAFKTLNESLKYKKWITAVGLDSSELGNPPSKFKNVFAEAINAGYIAVAHAGEEGPAEYVWDALKNLSVSRIDHGNKALDDNNLVSELVEKKVPLTVCPLSNIRLKNVDKIANHPIKQMLEKGLVATVNSDDPAYFGGYMNDNYFAIADALDLTKEDIYKLTLNSFNSTFIDFDQKVKMTNSLKKYYNSNK